MLNKFLKNERIRSSLTSASSGLFTFILLTLFEYFKILEIKDNNKKEYFIFMLFCFMIGYTLDILFAKKTFESKIVPYDKLRERFNILINQYYLSPKLVKYLMVVVIDNIFNIIVVRYLINILNKYKILVNFKYRDVFLVFIVFGLSFLLYTHNLRFFWAYQKDSPLYLNLLVSFIFVLSILFYIFVVNRINTRNITKNKKKII